MAKINEYPQAATINNNDLFVIDQQSGGDHATKSASVSQIADKATSGVQTQIGDLSTLTTTDKSSLVGAINEIARYTPVYGNTASGSIATFDTSLALPLQDCTIDINAVQESGTPTPSSPKLISGFTSANVTRCGVNLMHVDSRVSQTTAHVTYTSDDNYIYLNGVKNGAGFAHLSNLTMTLPSGTYYLKAFVISGTGSSVSLYAFDGTNVISPNILGSEASMTLNNTTTFSFRFAIWADGTVLSNYKIGIVISKTSISEYSEYIGSIYNFAFTDGDNPLTVYGGSLDVTSGVLTVTHGIITFDGSGDEIWNDDTTRYSIEIADCERTAGRLEVLCNRGVYASSGGSEGTVFATNKYFYYYPPTSITSLADFKTWLGSNNLVVVYPLETPVTYQLTPTQISAIVGTNNVFTDTNGDTSVVYACSLKDYIDRQ